LVGLILRCDFWLKLVYGVALRDCFGELEVDPLNMKLTTFALLRALLALSLNDSH